MAKQDPTRHQLTIDTSRLSANDIEGLRNVIERASGITLFEPTPPTNLTRDDIERRIVTCDAFTLGAKTTVMHATLVNGFEIVVSSACVDPDAYDQAIGENICYERLIEKVWELEGYRLQERRFQHQQATPPSE